MRLSLLAAAILLSTCHSAPPLALTATADRIVVEKTAHRMTLYRRDTVLKVYRVALGRGGPGDKVQEGDKRVPEGIFRIEAHLTHSRFHRALHVVYPDTANARRAAALGVAPGGDIMIHGIRNGLGWLGPLVQRIDWTRGCIALTDGEVEEVFRAVPDGTVIEIRA